MTPPARTAAELAKLCPQHLGGRDLPQLAALFHPRGAWELAYPLEGLSKDSQTVRGAGRIARLHATLVGGLADLEIHDVDVHAVHDGLAYLEFRSKATTTKGVQYANSYACRVESLEGRIVLWREFFDPRPAELIRADVAEELRRRAAVRDDATRPESTPDST